MSTLVRIDPTLCRGHAICALHLADGVEIDRWGFGRILEPVLADRRAVARARRAAAACPNGAIAVLDDGRVAVTADPPVAQAGW
jgi:ferredoxin